MASFAEEIQNPTTHLTVSPVRASRARNGRWALFLRVRGRVELTAGRELHFDREFKATGDQRGSLPRGWRSHRKGCKCRVCKANK